MICLYDNPLRAVGPERNTVICLVNLVARDVAVNSAAARSQNDNLMASPGREGAVVDDTDIAVLGSYSRRDSNLIGPGAARPRDVDDVIRLGVRKAPARNGSNEKRYRRSLSNISDSIRVAQSRRGLRCPGRGCRR